MNKLTFLFIGVVIGMTFYACGMSKRKPDFDKFPHRSPEYSVWMKCVDDYENVCKYECLKYNKKNECKERRTVKMPIQEALDKSYVVISKVYFLKLIAP